MDVALACDGWEVESRDPPMRWDDQPAKRQKPIKTSFPVLFLSNSHDPVTPLYAGVKMATKFEGAGLVEQRSEGHCTIASVSLCTIGKIRAYLNDGIVPPPPILKKEGDFSEGEWDICEANEYPWKPYRGSGLGGDEPSGKDTVFAGPLDDNVYALAEASAKIRERMVQLVTSAHPSPLIRALTERFGMFFAGDVALLDKMLQLYQERRIHRRHLDMDAAEDRIRIL